LEAAAGGATRLELLMPKGSRSFELGDALSVPLAISTEQGLLAVDNETLDGARQIVELGCR
jgi:hypothetical protein